jgi:hypothetical protein
MGRRRVRPLCTSAVREIEQHNRVGDHDVDQHQLADERGQIEHAAGNGHGDEGADDDQRQRDERGEPTGYAAAVVELACRLMTPPAA